MHSFVVFPFWMFTSSVCIQYFSLLVWIKTKTIRVDSEHRHSIGRIKTCGINKQALKFPCLGSLSYQLSFYIAVSFFCIIPWCIGLAWFDLGPPLSRKLGLRYESSHFLPPGNWFFTSSECEHSVVTGVQRYRNLGVTSVWFLQFISRYV